MKQKIIQYIGVDVGGTKILAQGFDAKLKLIAEKMVMTDVDHGKTGFLKQLFGLIDGFFEKGVKGIGVAVPGIVDYRKGILVKAPHLPTGKNLKLKSLIEKRFKTPTHVDHDINAFLVAESLTPALRKYRNVLAIMVGTGLGGAALVDGKLFYGERGFAGEFGHMVIDEEGTLKTLEERTSGHSMRAIAKSLKLPQPARWGGHFLEERLAKKDPQALRLLASIIESLGIGLSNLSLAFNPQAIVLGGSVFHRFMTGQKKRLKAIIARHSLSGKAPELIDACEQTSVAKGAVLLLIKKWP